MFDMYTIQIAEDSGFTLAAQPMLLCVKSSAENLFLGVLKRIICWSPVLIF